MSIHFNHTLVFCRDKERSASFLAEMLGRPTPGTFGVFRVVQLDNEVSLDFMQVGAAEFQTQHYAFLLGEEEFDEVFARIEERALDYWADPFKQKPGEINHNDEGRGVYFPDPDGHLLEVITRPYGSGA